MKIGVLGTGMVGATLASRLVALGHEVRMGAREKGNAKAKAWATGAGQRASTGDFADAAAFGEIVLNCTLGEKALEALRAAKKENLKGKVVVDVSNPLDFSRGMPPRVLTGPNGESLGEQIQQAFPEARVVKALNSVNAHVMVDPQRIGGESDLFLCGNDASAKERVVALLGELGWRAARVHDLGPIVAARGTEAYLLFWLTLMGAFKTADFNVRIVRKES
jgi:8-hydroxy-5-deazaflavin:NADPH oxidoreductase